MHRIMNGQIIFANLLFHHNFAHQVAPASLLSLLWCWWKYFFWCKTYHSGFVWSAMCSFSFYYICILSRTVWSLLQWFSLTELNSKSRWIDQKWFINRLSSGCWIKNIWPPIGSVTWFDKNVTKSHFRHCDKFNTRWRTLPKKVWFLILSFLDCKCYMKL